MYPAIKANIDRIVQETYAIWKQGGDDETYMKTMLKEANMSDWMGDARDKLIRIIRDGYLESKIYKVLED
jgi:hypothetical protein